MTWRVWASDISVDIRFGIYRAYYPWYETYQILSLSCGDNVPNTRKAL